jgi:hypothetical protein
MDAETRALLTSLVDTLIDLIVHLQGTTPLSKDDADRAKARATSQLTVLQELTTTL